MPTRRAFATPIDIGRGRPLVMLPGFGLSPHVYAETTLPSTTTGCIDTHNSSSNMSSGSDLTCSRANPRADYGLPRRPTKPEDFDADYPRTETPQ
jgi:hypothetical protein